MNKFDKTDTSDKLDNEAFSMLTEGDTLLQHMCALQFNLTRHPHRFTPIVCTIGKSSRNVDTLVKMMEAGMNVVRLNFSHDTHEFHLETIEMVRKAAAKYSKDIGMNYHVAIALDTKGPKIRTGLIENNNEIELKKNDTMRLSINKDLMDKGNKEVVFVDYPNIINVVFPGTKICINDGAITVIVKEVAVDCLICQVDTGGILGSRKNVNIVGVEVDLPPVSEKDVYDLKFGVNNNVDFIFASTIRHATAIAEIRNVLGEKGKDIKVIAKIENQQGLLRADEIIEAADGILVARSDIGIEIDQEKVFLIQKALIARCNRAGKPVICGTNMLESMFQGLRPSRAEIYDMGNTILDGADALMLSGVTAIGSYPVESVQTLRNTILEAEAALWYRRLFEDLVARCPAALDAAHAVAIGAVDMAKKCLATAIIVLTTSGKSAHLISKYRPRCPILAVTRCSRTARQSFLYRGIFPILYTESPNTDWVADIDSRVQYGLHIGKKNKIITAGDSIVVVSAWKDGPGFTNTVRIVYAFFQHESFECMLKADKSKDKVLNKKEKEQLKQEPAHNA